MCFNETGIGMVRPSVDTSVGFGVFLSFLGIF